MTADTEWAKPLAVERRVRRRFHWTVRVVLWPLTFWSGYTSNWWPVAMSSAFCAGGLAESLLSDYVDRAVRERERVS